MKNFKSPFALLCMALVVACFHVSVWGQAIDQDKLATIRNGGSSLRWDVSASNSGVTLTVSAPDGRVFRSEFKAGISPEFTLSDKDGKLPDGQYTYELRLIPVISPDVKEALAAARVKGNDAEVEREMRKRGMLPAKPLVNSGGFTILNGSAIVPGDLDEGARQVGTLKQQPRVPAATKQPRDPAAITGTTVSRLQRHHALLNPMPDFVIADDLIVQGSACVGLDCVNGEVFGFDTIRMKENNTRIQFDDTSTSAGFPTNNWQIRANSSASGGESFLGILDQGATGNSETGTIVAQFDAGAPANSLRVSSLGRIGNRTATPVLDIHTNTGNTPAIRLEQNNTGGFTAQTWDIGANEANFFVRDVTGGSRLSFRIRPGAPTSSLDISADGFVGMGTGSPATFASGTLSGGNFAHLFSTATAGLAVTGTFPELLLFDSNGTANNRIFQIMQDGGLAKIRVLNDALSNLTLDNVQVWNMSNGRVGIGTAAPDQVLSVNGDASKAGGGSWQIFSDERLKTIKGHFNSGLKAVMQLQPLRFEYKANNALGLKSEGEFVGFGAQSVQKIIPEAVSENDRGYLMVNNDPIIWTMLNAIKEQQKEIEQLKTEVRRLRATSRKRR